MEALTQDQTRFLDENPFVGVVTTLRRDGSPHSTIVWVDASDGGVSFNTARGRVKPTNLERDPRLSLVVVDPDDAYKWVSVTGRARMTEAGADEQIDRLSAKYTGNPEYQARTPDEVRVRVDIAVEKADSSGFGT